MITRFLDDPTTGEFTLPQDGQYLTSGLMLEILKIVNIYVNQMLYELHQFYPGDALIAHSSTHNRLNLCETGTINGNAGATYRFINTSNVDFELVPNDRYSGSFTITKIN